MILGDKYSGLRIKLGDYESTILRDKIDQMPIEKPVYITGLARGGTTLLLEILAHHKAIATHQYRDFQMIFTPYFWGRFMQFTDRFRPDDRPQERAHQDRIMVTPKSPESMEEMIWMMFFASLDDPHKNAVLDAGFTHPVFERFYTDHIKKLILVRKARRYISKANYNVTRIGYLLKLFPDARFLIAVRHPLTHIASLKKQHALFLREQKKDAARLVHTDISGHFEFGLHRSSINVGSGQTLKIEKFFQDGQEIHGWAYYWTDIYGYVLRLLENFSEAQRAQVKVVPYESLCENPESVLSDIFRHCDLADYQEILERYKARIEPPSYYSPDFSDRDRDVIFEATRDVAEKYGYSF